MRLSATLAAIGVSVLAVGTMLAAAVLSIATAAAEQSGPPSWTWDSGPPSIVFTINSKTLVTIKPDGTIVYGEDYSPDEAARAFWTAIGRNKPDKDCR